MQDKIIDKILRSRVIKATAAVLLVFSLIGTEALVPEVAGAAVSPEYVDPSDITNKNPLLIMRASQMYRDLGVAPKQAQIIADESSPHTATRPSKVTTDKEFETRSWVRSHIDSYKKYLINSIADDKIGSTANKGTTVVFPSANKAGDVAKLTVKYPVVGSYAGSTVGAKVTYNFVRCADDCTGGEMPDYYGSYAMDYDYIAVQLGDNLFSGVDMRNINYANVEANFFYVDSGAPVALDGNTMFNISSLNSYSDNTSNEYVYGADSLTNKVQLPKGGNTAVKPFGNGTIGYGFREDGWVDELDHETFFRQSVSMWQSGTSSLKFRVGGGYSPASGSASGSGMWWTFTGASLATPELDHPTKTVDKTEAAVGERINYAIDQQVAYAGSEILTKYNALKFSDKIPDGTSYIDNSATVKMITDDGTITDVTKTAGSWIYTPVTKTLVYNFSSNYLKAMKLEGQTYRFEFGVTADGNEGIAIVENKATVILNNKASFDSNLVHTLVNTAEVAISKEAAYEHRVGDEVEYTLTLLNKTPNSVAIDVEVRDDTLPDDMTIYDAAINGALQTVDYPLVKDGKLTTEQRTNTFSITTSGNTLDATISYLPYNTPVTITYKVAAQEHYNGTELVNTAQATWGNPTLSANIPKKASDIIWINTPNMTPIKTSDDAVHKVGDIIKYKIDVTNEDVGTVARNVVVTDLFETEGIELDRSSIVLSDSAGNVITDNYAVTQNVHEQGFRVETKRNLVNPDNYQKYEKAAGMTDQAAKNPLGYTNETLMHIEFGAKIIDADLAGKQIVNNVSVSSDENPGGTDKDVTPVNGPVLTIDKKASTQQAALGETVTYTLTVKQTRENLVAKNVVLADSFSGDCAERNVDSIRVYDENHADITADCTIATENELNIETHRDLADDQVIYVTYDATIHTLPEDELLTNVATAHSDNTPDAIDKAIVSVYDPTPFIPEALDPAKIEVVKDSTPADGTEVSSGQQIDYSLLVKNTGGTTAFNIAVFDSIPRNTEYSDHEITHNATYNKDADAMAWNITELAAGETVELRFTAAVKNDLTEEVAIRNFASYAPDHPGIPTAPLDSTTNEVTHHVVMSKAFTPEDTHDKTGNILIDYAWVLCILAGVIIVAGSYSIYHWRKARRINRRNSFLPYQK